MSSSQMIVFTPRLILRPLGPADAAGTARRECPDPRTGPVAWAVTLRETGETAGRVGIGPREELGGEVELSYAISERHAGRGYATEAAKAAVWWAFERGGLDYLAALALPGDAASRRVLDKLGFVPAGTRRFAGGDTVQTYDYLRFYRLDRYESPDWTPEYRGEPMDAFFERRVDGYEAHMLSGPGAAADYAEAVEPVGETDEPIEVLDLGCGTGLELRWLFRRAPNARVTCVDLSAAMLERLKSNYTDRLGQITVVQASYIDWRYPEGAYDYALSANTMHHFPEPVKVGIYRNVLKALKPGGKYVESDFMVDDAMMEQYRRRWRRIMDAAGQGGAEPGALHADMPLTPTLQKELLRNAGFARVVSHRERIQPQHSGAVLVAEK
jgi:tRNA (cmo5U34)-methyltransferase